MEQKLITKYESTIRELQNELERLKA